jgi:hypothetical protein
MARRPRDICSTSGCNNLQAASNYNPPTWRRYCHQCHNTRTASKHGLKSISEVVAKNAGYNSVKEYKDACAVKEGYKDYADRLNQEAIAEGWKSYTHKQNSKHPYLKYRKEYCENLDSRLGYKCTTNVVWDGMLDVDHINGNHQDNRPENLQTLCKCCHAYKTNINEDYKTTDQIQESTDCLEQSTIA